MKLYFIATTLATIATALIVMAPTKKMRMMFLIASLVLQHVTLLLFMVDYEQLGREAWREREKKLQAALSKKDAK